MERKDIPCDYSEEPDKNRLTVFGLKTENADGWGIVIRGCSGCKWSRNKSWHQREVGVAKGRIYHCRKG